MSGITFGSVGDIVAVGEIAWNIAKALRSTRGSAQEYQKLVKELEFFNKALLQVVAVWQNYANSPELVELGATIQDAIKDWRQVLMDFRSQMNKKYSASLCATGSGNRLKDASKKVLWLREKEDIVELRRKLHVFSDSIMLLSDAAQKKSDRLAEKDQVVRAGAVDRMMQESIRLAEQQVSQLEVLNKKMDSQAQTSAVILSTSRSVIVSLNQMRTVLELNNAVAQHSVPGGIDTHWKQAPVTMELFTGKSVPIPLELVNTWEMLDTVLSELFRRDFVYEKIHRKEFIVYHESTGHEVDRRWALDTTLRPGDKVNMSIILYAEPPKCGCVRGILLYLTASRDRG